MNSITKKIVLTALFCALLAVVNAYFTIRISPTFKVSLLICFSFFTGIVLGGWLGFVAGFVGDFLGWLLFVDGIYNPIIGVASGLFCFIPGILNDSMIKFNIIKNVKKGRVAVVFGVSAVLCYVICTLLLTSAGVWLAAGINPENYTFLNKYDSFWAYVAARAVSQFPNNLINMFLAYGVFCVFDTIKFTSAYLR